MQAVKRAKKSKLCCTNGHAW